MRAKGRGMSILGQTGYDFAERLLTHSLAKLDARLLGQFWTLPLTVTFDSTTTRGCSRVAGQNRSWVTARQAC
jgi:hypothetical protein